MTSYSPRLGPAAMTRGLYPTVIASLACGASGFLVRSSMGPFSTAALRRTSMTSRRLTRGGATQAGAGPRMASEHYDYLVIGGGSGGVSSARRAATYDAKVCVFPCTNTATSCRAYSMCAAVHGHQQITRLIMIRHVSTPLLTPNDELHFVLHRWRLSRQAPWAERA